MKKRHSGRGFMFVRNLFAAPGGFSYRSTADYWFHSDFNRGDAGIVEMFKLLFS